MDSRRVVCPRIVSPPSPRSRAFRLLLLVVAVGVAGGGVYFFRSQLGLDASRPTTESMRAVERDRDALSAQAEELRHRIIVLERSQQIDRETNRAASEQLKVAQDERLALEKEVSFLRRLIGEGGGGILQPTDFELKSTERPREFRYSLTIRQLIQDFGESTGSVEIQVVGKRDGAEVTLPLSKLKGSEPTRHKMSFKHFQNFEGSISIPEGFEPENLVVDIKPSTNKLVPVSEVFPWKPEQ